MIKGNGIALNTSATTDAVNASKDAIVSILNCRADQETIRVALECLKGSCCSGSASIANCVVNGCDNSGIASIEDEEDNT